MGKQRDYKEEYRRSRKTKTNNKTQCVCVVCGDTFYVNNDEMKRLGRGQYCSKACYGNGNRGNNHYNWKGGITRLKEAIRKRLIYKNWRKRVFKRDNYTCSDCNTKGGYLEAHHIVSYSDIIDENHIKSIDDAMNCEQLWDIDNGKTLCILCHEKYSKRGG